MLHLRARGFAPLTLICHKCPEMTILRSNVALAEEIERLSGYLEPRVHII